MKSQKKDVALKKCKGTGQAIGHGCGVVLPFCERNGIKTYKNKYGLGYDCKCYNKWLLNTENGQELIYKNSIKAKAEVQKDIKAIRQQKKVELMSNDLYRKKYIQPKINELIRIIDFDQPCIATGATSGKMNAGHYHSTGSSRTLTFNAHNIFLQSEHSNSYKGGDNIRYLEGLIATFGNDYADYILRLKQSPLVNLNRLFLVELNQKLIEYKKTLVKIRRTPEQRISERNRLNEYTGIYSSEFSIYTKK